jgi:transcriptional regulator with XRE-family HTH domain
MNRQPDLTRALERIAEIRKCPCFTPKRLLADELGVSLSAVTQWEQNGMPLHRAYEIQALTGVPVKEILPFFEGFQGDAVDA